jgi:hypothetical protein
MAQLGKLFAGKDIAVRVDRAGGVFLPPTRCRATTAVIGESPASRGRRRGPVGARN